MYFRQQHFKILVADALFLQRLYGDLFFRLLMVGKTHLACQAHAQYGIRHHVVITHLAISDDLLQNDALGSPEFLQDLALLGLRDLRIKTLLHDRLERNRAPAKSDYPTRAAPPRRDVRVPGRRGLGRLLRRPHGSGGALPALFLAIRATSD